MNGKLPLLIVAVTFLISLYFVAQGIGMHQKVGIEEAKFHQLQDEYFTLSKATRDGAATGSDLNKKLVQIQQYPSELLKLKLVGVGKILTGIYALLFCLLIALILMPARLGMALKNKPQ